MQSAAQAARCHAPLAAAAGRDLRNLAARLGQFLHDPPGAFGQRPPGLGQDDAPPGAGTDGKAKDGLYLRQKARGGGLGNPQPLCRRADMAGLGKGDHHLQMAELDAAGQEAVRFFHGHLVMFSF